MDHKGLNQLLCAATVNMRFRETLLRNPAQAIAAGYLGCRFTLTPEEQSFVVGIRARRLEDFAAQVYHWISDSGQRHTGLALAAEPFGDSPFTRELSRCRRFPLAERRIDEARMPGARAQDVAACAT